MVYTGYITVDDAPKPSGDTQGGLSVARHVFLVRGAPNERPCVSPDGFGASSIVIYPVYTL